MDVLQIVEENIRMMGYGGLFSECCACEVDDLAPCGEMKQDCTRGHKHTHSVTGEFVISQKREMTDDEIQSVIDAI
jgi:hypothetical protein